MNACTVIDLEDAKARRIAADQHAKNAKALALAMAKLETVDSLADDLRCYAPGPERARAVMYYLAKGWATDTDMQLALEALG